MKTDTYKDGQIIDATFGAHELPGDFSLLRLMTGARTPAPEVVRDNASLTDSVRIVARATATKLGELATGIAALPTDRPITSSVNLALAHRIVIAAQEDLKTSRSGAAGVETIRALERLARDIETGATKDDENAKEIASILTVLRDVANDLALLKVALDASKLQADGIHRGWVSVLSPHTVEKLRERRGLDPVACDLLIVGAGPAGIAAAHHAQSLGIDTVLVEATYFAASMSDARALPVHLMRTSSGGSSLARPGVMPEGVIDEIGMDRLMKRLNVRETAAAARQHISDIESRRLPDSLPGAASPSDTEAPVARGEVYAYFMEILHRALRSDRLIATEQTPISEVRWMPEDERFLVRSSIGHELRPRYLVVASGAVGAMAENRRQIPLLTTLAMSNPERYVEVTDERTLLDQQVSGKQVILPDAWIGLSSSRDYIRTLPAGTDAVVIGSGESAAKGALALLELNPAIRVNLIVKGRLEPIQGQGPAFGGFKDAVVRGIEDPDFGKMTLKILRDHYGTPITPESMHDLLLAVHRGSMRIFEMGAYFDEESVAATPREVEGRNLTEFKIRAERSDVTANLQRQWNEWSTVGLIPAQTPCPLLEGALLIDGPIVVAAGYNKRSSVSNNPVLSQLLEQKEIALESSGGITDGEIALDAASHLFSRNNDHLAFSGAMLAHNSLDGVFSGAGVRSWLVVHEIARRLGLSTDNPPAFTPVEPSGVQALQPDPETHFVRQNHLYRPGDRFPGNPYLTRLAQKQGELHPADQLLLRRADAFFHLLRVTLRTNSVSPF